MTTKTTGPAPASLRAQSKSSAFGLLVGMAFGIMWFALGFAAVPAGRPRYLLLAGGVLLLLGSAGVYFALLRLSRRIPERVPGLARTPSGPRFITILMVEVVVLAVGNNLLSGHLHHPEWMLVWSALVVGVHFLPLSLRLTAPGLRVLGAFMVVIGIVTAVVASRSHADHALWQSIPGVGCAFAIWLAVLAGGLRSIRAVRARAA